MKNLLQKIKTWPGKPGIYQFLDKQGKILYVGKAKNLKKRVVSYFLRTAKLPKDKQLMIGKAVDAKMILTDNETEALLLENNLVKEHRPPYNVLLKDDKNFQFIRIDFGEDYPKIGTVRRITDSKSQYFGPFTDGLAVKRTLKLLKQLFPYRDCAEEIQTGKTRRKRPCLKYYLNKCLAPCIGKVSPEDYNALIEKCALFLEGKVSTVVKELKAEMAKAAKDHDFERAAVFRDQIQDLEKIGVEQKIVAPKMTFEDYLALYRGKDSRANALALILVREGKIIGEENFYLEAPRTATASEIISTFVLRHYQEALNLPKTIIAAEKLDFDFNDLKNILSRRLPSKKVASLEYVTAVKGRKKKILDLGLKNAAEFLNARRLEANNLRITLEDLQDALKLPSLPERIECYDISNIQGQMATASKVTFLNGRPAPSEYRRFKIKTVKGANDTAMMREVLRRRLSQTSLSDNQAPDLIVLDGGKPQLNTGLKVLRELDLSVPMVALAKREEEIFVANYLDEKSTNTVVGARRGGAPLRFDRESPALKLLMRIRDEAHRFAKNYYQKLHQKDSVKSALDDVPGLGPKNKKKLLVHFGSVAKIRQAGVSELKTVVGENLAKKIKEKL